jgi:hypothetical protein
LQCKVAQILKKDKIIFGRDHNFEQRGVEEF